MSQKTSEMRKCSVDYSAMTSITIVSKEENAFQFSPRILHFGVLPLGVEVKKHVSVIHLWDAAVEWSIMDISYDTDIAPYFHRPDKTHKLSAYSGPAENRYHKTKLTYTITTNEPKRCITFLLLSNCREPLKVEDICIVIYEAIQYDIVVNTGHTVAPILCPLEVIYVGVPVEIKFTIENRSPITGCFYILKPYGQDSGIITTEFKPAYSILFPNETKEVCVTLTCKEVGIFENYYVPCFIGMYQEPITFRILCAVDGLQVFFYLPSDEVRFKKILWPLKVIYEYDVGTLPCDCEEEEYYGEFEIIEQPEYQSADTLKSEASKTKCDSFSGSFVKSTNNVAKEKDVLAKFLKKKFPEDFHLLERTIEIRNLSLNTPVKVSFYIENVTPINSDFTVESQNFFSNKDFGDNLLRFNSMKKEEIWNDITAPQFGIVVHPEIESGDIPAKGSVKINLWIHANTFGIYTEEIIVDVGDLPCFSFSMIIQVVGCPIMFPMALNGNATHPIVRLGSLPYNTKPFTRQLRIVNQSFIPVTITWLSFLRVECIEDEDQKMLSIGFRLFEDDDKPVSLSFFDADLGTNIHGFCRVEPELMRISESSDTFLTLAVDADYFPLKEAKTVTVCNIIGRIDLSKEYQLKPKYFYRPIGKDIQQLLKIEVHATLERPLLTVDFPSSLTKIKIYAAEVIAQKQYEHSMRLLFQNHEMVTSMVTISVDQPFYLRNSKKEKCQKIHSIVKPSKSLELMAYTYTNYNDLIQLGDLLYDETKASSLPISYSAETYYTNTDEKILTIESDCVIHVEGNAKEVFQLRLYIFFPNISVKPSLVKFDSVLVGNTCKDVVIVYNLTGYEVQFEIYKSEHSEDFQIKPHYGTIAKSTGANKSFVYISVYFTPSQCMQYQESFRIVTNLPNYFIEIPLKGTGMLNEKFYKNYKI